MNNTEHENRINEPITFAKLALGLANDYYRIYVIDSDDDSYVEYAPSGHDKELVVASSGEDFFASVPVQCREQVYPEDQETFLAAFKKSNVINALSDGKAFTLRYRLNFPEGPRYFFLKTIRDIDSNIIIGVRDVDEETRRELAATAASRIYSEIAESLASLFEVIYHIDINTGAYTEYSSSESFARLGLDRSGEDFFKKMLVDIPSIIHPDDCDMLINILNKKSLESKLSRSNSFSVNYRQVLDGKIVYVNLLVLRQHNDCGRIVMGLRNIDDQIKREETMALESRTFGEIAKALAQRYEVIYRVNLITNEYSEYSASEKYAKLKVGTKGADFFAETMKNMKHDIYKEDLPMMTMAMQKDFLLDSLKETGKNYLNYRLMLDGRPQYVTLFAVRPKEDSEHIIIAVANVDAARRKELDYENALGSAMDMANRDVLTGVKNKRAYAQAEMQLDEQITLGSENIEFSIVICDVNGLKDINDNLGHKAGDEYIKNACRMICDVFKHSPVFRIGGDEFSVILKDSDYASRHEIVNNLRAMQNDISDKGKATVAIGMSDFIAGKDMRVQDVFERADNAMYENKRIFKSGSRMPVPNTVSNSDISRTIKFYELFEQLVSAMAEIGRIDIPRIENTLIDISLMFRLSKGITRLYRNPQEEIQGGGETLCCFDTGKEGKPIISLRVMTSMMSIAKMTVYMSDDEEPLTDEERWRVELVMRCTLSFVSRNRLKDLIEELAYCDDDGYPNLRSLINYLTRYLSKCKLGGKVVAHYNLRHYSLINEQVGRETGDKIMKMHFDKLKSVIGEDGLICRLGGDNFVAVFEKNKFNSIKELLTEAAIVYNEDGDSVKVRTTAGVFVVPEDYSEQNPGEVMGKIVTAYRAAQSGGNEQIVIYNDELAKSKEKSMRVQQLFNDGLKNKEFHAFYQPKVDVRTGDICGAEALCRWIRNGKIIPPAEFIPSLEKTTDICRLDLYMLEEVCADLRRWLDEGRNVVRISFNMSRKHLLDPSIVQRVIRIIDKHDVPHELIEVELTETVTNVEFNDLKRVVTSFKQEGIFTSIDDFGTGFSSMNLLNDIPWDCIKIDRSLLPCDGEEENSRKMIMFSHITSLSAKLGLECIAEGVETEEQIGILKSMNCDYAQGFYFDRPISVEEFEKKLDMGRYSK